MRRLTLALATCGTDLRGEVTEDGQEVWVDVSVAEERPNCTLPPTVRLRSRLGDRRVFDGSSGEEVAVRRG